ncbi:MAG: GGDEF domain-containing protein [Campylobacter sp.]|nr:GGDEF domain-containing protein [Campylobacter sp.]
MFGSKCKKTFKNFVTLSIVVVATIVTFVFTLFQSYLEYSYLENERQILTDFYISDQKIKLKNEIYGLVSNIDKNANLKASLSEQISLRNKNSQEFSFNLYDKTSDATKFANALALVQNNKKEAFKLTKNENEVSDISFAKAINSDLIILAHSDLGKLNQKLQKHIEVFKQNQLSRYLGVFAALLAFGLAMYMLKIYGKKYKKYKESKEISLKEFENVSKTLKEKIANNADNKNSVPYHQYKNIISLFANIIKLDSNFKITSVNESICKNVNKCQEKLIGKDFSYLCEELYYGDIDEVYEYMREQKVWHGILNLKTKNSKYAIHAVISPFNDPESHENGYIVTGYDVSKFVITQEYIKRHLHDPLTKLPNRQALIDKISSSDEYSFIACLDIIKFKQINEYYGFNTGDKVLEKIAKMLKKIADEKDLELFKLSNDNFAFIGKSDKWDIQSFKNYADEIVSQVKNKAIIINGNKFNINVVFGISSDVSQLISAEIARDYAKQNKVNSVIFDEKKETLIRTINLTQEVKKAIEDNRIVLYKQGIIDNSSKKIIKYECLMRMIDRNGKIIAPCDFLNIAKESDLYKELTKIVIANSFEYFDKHKENFSINFAIDDILSSEILDFLKAKLLKYKDIGKRLTIEIVEDEGIGNFEKVLAFIKEVKTYGCKVAIDDFGTGYSNFEYLLRLNADIIKFDGSMIKNIDKDEHSRRIVELMVAFSKDLGVDTVAEFVHSKEVSNVINDIGINSSQGYFCDEPKPLELAS